jgi:hypothetical protein
VVITLQLKQHEELLVTAAALLNLQRVVLSGVSRVADGYRAWRVREQTGIVVAALEKRR